MSGPVVVVIAGPNGAGKTTSARSLLPNELELPHFVNADTIAAGLSAFDPDSVAITAGRIMLARIHELARRRESFAFETTLASRTFAPLLKRLAEAGYRRELIFLWIADPELAIARVLQRTRLGGHAVPPEVVRRRYEAGRRNFFSLYRPLVTDWRLYDNSGERPVLIAAGSQAIEVVEHDSIWRRIQCQAGVQ
ncbi:MAG: zeta toxin family protein [Chloroflexi bacterium]|nr:zeta toxin family protein [Chloroflexota bacterium]